MTSPSEPAIAHHAARPSNRSTDPSPTRTRPADDGRMTPVGAAAPAEGSAESLATRLRDRIGARSFDMWFDREMACVSVRRERDGVGLTISASSQYVADWISRHFDADLKALAREALGERADVAMRVEPDRFAAATSAMRAAAGGGARTRRPGDRLDPESDPNRAMPPASGEDHGQRPLPLPPQRRPGRRRDSADAERGRAALRRLEDFVVGPSNRLALDAGRRVAEAEAGSPHLFFVHGDCGVGKTHLLQGICERRRELFPRQRIRYTTAEQFTNEYINALRENALEAFRKSLRRLDLLAIDDIHFLSNKTATQGEFLHTMDAIDLSGARIVLASDEHPRQIRKFSRSLISRFLSGMVVHVDRPDRDTRLLLVRRLAAERGLPLHQAAQEFIANRCVGSVREIEGALTRVAAFALLSGEGPTDDGSASGCGQGAPTHGAPPAIAGVGLLCVERALADEGGRPSGPVRLADLIEQVCGRLGVEREDFLGSSRHRRVVMARGIVVHLGRELTNHSFPEIARAMGRDNHSTAHSAARRIAELLAANERVECPDASFAGPDGQVPLTELIAQLRHEILRRPNER